MPLLLILGAAIVAGGMAAGGAVGYLSYQYFGYRPRPQMLGYPVPFPSPYYGQPYSPSQYAYQYPQSGHWRLYVPISGY
jgi:hypothetical protein